MPNYNALTQTAEETTNAPSTWDSMRARVRGEVDAALMYGKATANIALLITLAGILYWCPRCGQWMGSGSEGVGSNVPDPGAPPPPPRRLLRALSMPIQGEPIDTRDMPKRHSGYLRRNSHILETFGTHRGAPAKIRSFPPSDAHGRKVDTLHGGYPKPDSYPHGHDATFVRGDAEEILLYDRLKDGTVVYESETDVAFRSEEGYYTWKPKGAE